MQQRLNQLQYELEISRLRAHEKHMKYIYGIRLGGLALAGLTIIIGSVMIFLGLQGAFDWAIQAPNSIGAKLTNASPGIVFATAGMFIGLFVILQVPVNFRTGTSNLLNPSRSNPRGIQLGGDGPSDADFYETDDNFDDNFIYLRYRPNRRRVQKS